MFLDTSRGNFAPSYSTANFVYVGNDGTSDAFDAMQYAIAPIISIIYGACETMFGQMDADMYGFFMDEAVAQGQTLIAVSGDAGATGDHSNHVDLFNERGHTDRHSRLDRRRQ